MASISKAWSLCRHFRADTFSSTASASMVAICVNSRKENRSSARRDSDSKRCSTCAILAACFSAQVLSSSSIARSLAFCARSCSSACCVVSQSSSASSSADWVAASSSPATLLEHCSFSPTAAATAAASAFARRLATNLFIAAASSRAAVSAATASFRADSDAAILSSNTCRSSHCSFCSASSTAVFAFQSSAALTCAANSFW